MPLRAAESCSKKCLNQFPSKSVTDHEAAETDHIEIVIFDALAGGKRLMNETRANAGNFVRSDRCPNSAATDGNAPLHIAASNRAGQRHDIIWIVIVKPRVAVSEIYDFITGFP